MKLHSRFSLDDLEHNCGKHINILPVNHADSDKVDDATIHRQPTATVIL
jgi:hypothetical protein